MAISFKVDGVEISAIRDRTMFNTFAGNKSYVCKGIGDEMAVSYSAGSFVVTLGSGEAVICGGSAVSSGNESLSLNANASGYLVLRVDLSETLENICKFMAVASLVQTNINNGTNTVYDLPLYRFVTNSTGISTITDVRELFNSPLDSLATVARTGNYNDLTNKPSIPSQATVDSSMSSSSTNAVQNKVINTQLATKAPTNHRSTADTYGVADNENYGHVKVANNLQASVHNVGIALSAYQGYLLNQNKANAKIKTKKTSPILNDRFIIADSQDDYLLTGCSVTDIAKLLFPVGSIYATYEDVNPTNIIGGSWVLLNVGGKVDVGGTIKGNGKTLGLFDGTQGFGFATGSDNDTYNGGRYFYSGTNAYNKSLGTTSYSGGLTKTTNAYRGVGLSKTASESGIIADTINCYLWRRTA